MSTIAESTIVPSSVSIHRRGIAIARGAIGFDAEARRLLGRSRRAQLADKVYRIELERAGGNPHGLRPGSPPNAE
jgi:hypothetical protein